MSRSWQEVQTLLDDPFVDADTKEHLLAAYIKENVEGYPFIDEDDLPDDVRGYYDQYPIRGGDFDQGSLDDVYDDAQAESEERGYSAGLTQDEIDENSATLDGQQAPQLGNRGGVEKSDEIFELARPALKVFENFIPVNDAVPGDSLGRHGKITMEEVTERFEEQLGISLQEVPGRRGPVAGRGPEAVRAELHDGDGAQQPVQVVDGCGGERVVPALLGEDRFRTTTDLLDYLSESPATIETLVQNVFAECKAKADTIIGLYQPHDGQRDA